MKIYLVESNKGKIQIATKLYLHEGSHKNIIEIDIQKYNLIKNKINNETGLFVDELGNNLYFRNHGVRNEVYFKTGIKNITEFLLNSFEDLFEICCNKNICSMNKVRLVEKFNEEIKNKTILRHIGTAVVWSEFSNEAKDDAVAYCGICDFKVDGDWNFCPDCGEKLLIHGRDIC